MVGQAASVMTMRPWQVTRLMFEAYLNIPKTPVLKIRERVIRIGA
jgi:hypothetical protein